MLCQISIDEIKYKIARKTALAVCKLGKMGAFA